MPWGPDGFIHDLQRGDVVAPHVQRFLAEELGGSSHVFFSWQPRDRARPTIADYTSAWDQLWATAPDSAARALHHTALNLGAVDGYQRGALFEFTNALVDRYRLQWINEDLGLWSLAGKPLPYPLPPYLTTAGLRAAIAAVGECQRQLAVPLVVEFPGFSQGVSLPIGSWDAYDYFRELAHESDAPVTFDIGHLLSWRWLRGLRGEALYGDLERLPLAHCFEIHLSGCEIIGDRFIDAHHGVLLEEQFELLARVLPLCRNLRAITFEDPKWDGDGRMLASNRASHARLAAMVDRWLAQPMVSHEPDVAPAIVTSDVEVEPAVIDAALADLLYQPDARRALRNGDHQRFGAAAPLLADLEHDELDAVATAIGELVMRRCHRGTGGLASWYPRTIAAWHNQHPNEDLASALMASPAIAAWRESADDRVGISLEQAFFDFAEAGHVGSPTTREREFTVAVVRSLVVCPQPAWQIPARLRRCPGGWFAVCRDDANAMLVAALRDRFVSGPITPMLAALLLGDTPIGEPATVDAARRELVTMGLLAAVPRDLRHEAAPYLKHVH